MSDILSKSLNADVVLHIVACTLFLPFRCVNRPLNVPPKPRRRKPLSPSCQVTRTKLFGGTIQEYVEVCALLGLRLVTASGALATHHLSSSISIFHCHLHLPPAVTEAQHTHSFLQISFSSCSLLFRCVEIGRSGLVLAVS